MKPSHKDGTCNHMCEYGEICVGGGEFKIEGALRPLTPKQQREMRAKYFDLFESIAALKRDAAKRK